MAWLIEELKKLTNSCFYGKIVISFERGRVVNLKRVENMKPPV